MVLMKSGLNITTFSDSIILVNPNYQKNEERKTQVTKNVMRHVNCFLIFVHIFHLLYASESMSRYVKTSILSKSNNIFQQKGVKKFL